MLTFRDKCYECVVEGLKKERLSIGRDESVFIVDFVASCLFEVTNNQFKSSFLGRKWKLPGNYPIFTVRMEIYHYIERIGELSLPPIFPYNIYY